MTSGYGTMSSNHRPQATNTRQSEITKKPVDGDSCPGVMLSGTLATERPGSLALARDFQADRQTGANPSAERRSPWAKCDGATAENTPKQVPSRGPSWPSGHDDALATHPLHARGLRENRLG